VDDTLESTLSPAPEAGLADRLESRFTELDTAARLVINNGRLAGTVFELPETGIVGRHPSSDILLNDITVSRRHAEIRRDAGGYRIVDLGSLNGTYVNRERVEETALESGDEVQIGKFRFVFLFAGRREPRGSSGRAD
jgi:pSer/pThr/pTyr-binding forkhead associated (FHA) protein